MKEEVKTIPIRIYNFGHPLMKTEMLSLLGDKFASVLPEGTTLVSSPSEANVICWDGLITPKLRPYAEKIIEELKSGKVLLLIGEPLTLAETNPRVKVVDVSNLHVVSTPGWNVLPEELIDALFQCHKKINHV